jgi:hypothetical protein
MADEITFRFSSNAQKSSSLGSVDHKFPSEEFSITMVGNVVRDFIQEIGTTTEDVDLGDVGAGCWLMGINVTGTNYVELGKTVSAAFEPWSKMGPGEPSLPCRLAAGVTPRARANTAACKIRFILWAA